MGREKEYRQRLKYQVSSARKKSLESQIAVDLRSNLGMCETEAMLLSSRISRWVLSRPGIRGPEEIVVETAAGHNSFVRNGKVLTKKIKLTPFLPEDLDLELEMGLSAMQLGRIMRLIEEAWVQDALLTAKQLGELCNLTPTALRAKLQRLRRLGIWVPVQGLSREERERGGMPRSTWAMSRYLAGDAPGEIRKAAAMSRERWRDTLGRFSALAQMLASGEFQPQGIETASWAELIRHTPSKDLKPLLAESTRNPVDSGDWLDFRAELMRDFGMSPVKVRAVREMVEEIRNHLSGARADHEVVYWAVAVDEPPGKPLDACRLVPVRLTLFEPGDLAGESANRVSGMKFKKVVRYATQAKYQGGYLTYADLGYLLGIHTEAIRRLIGVHAKLVVPLRGQECDIGRGVTHRKKIVELYLQMYTETEIVARTGHSYEAIENYIKEFAAVLMMAERGMGATLIRRVLGRSLNLVKTYLDLVHKYSAQPEYALRLQHLRQVFLVHEEKARKRGLTV